MDTLAVDPDFAKAIIQNIGLCWSKEELCDLKITVGEGVFACSHFHLCACSEFFDVLLYPGPSTTKATNFPEIRISGISSDIFAIVLNAVFKGENVINAENIIELWYAANHLQINFLIQKCEALIVEELTVDNYLNFYTHTLILKSEIVMDKILEIMTRNFDQLRQTQTFLDLPAETLLKLVERKNFESYDSLIDFVIQWVERDAGDKEESTCSNEMNNTSDINVDDPLCQVKDDGNKFVEVIFRNELLQPLVPSALVKRKDLLGTLMTCAQLNQVSNKSLKMLLDNDLVMDNREARNAVRKALASVLEREKQVKECLDTAFKGSENTTEASVKISGKDDDLVPVILFLKDGKMIAYKILTDQFFKTPVNISGHFYDISLNNNHICTYSLEQQSDFYYTHYYNLISQNLDINLIFSETNDTSTTKLIYDGSALYYLKHLQGKIEINRMKCTQNKGSGEWLCIGYIMIKNADNFKFLSGVTCIFKKNILLFSYDTKDKVHYVYYFNSITRMSNYKNVQLDSKQRIEDSITFTFNERFFILYGCGNLTEITEKNGEIECQCQPPLWNFHIKLYGAAVLDHTLYIFANLQTEKNLPTECQFGSVKFVKFLNNAKRCLFVHVSQNWLTTEL